MSLEDILNSAQSANFEVQKESLNWLSHKVHTDPSNFLLTLSDYLANPTYPLVPRQLAGYYIKNTIINSTKDPLLENLWEFVTSNCKIQIKNLVLGALADSHKEIRQVAAQIIAKLGQIEIPRGLWPEVLQILISNGRNTNPVHKETALMTLGYICEELPGSVLKKKDADEILTVIISGLSIEERSISIILTSLISLKNSIKFIKSNIELSEERKIILSALYGLCLHPSIEIRKESISVIDDIAYFYYDYIETDLIDLGNLTYNIIRNDEIPVALFAVEFWNIIADIEAERTANKIPHKNYIFTAACTLVPILLEKIHIFEEEDDESEWNLYKAVGTTITSITSIIKDSAIDLVYPYIAKNLEENNWKLQRSALLVFGSIMEGPSVASLRNLVKSCIDSINSLYSSENSIIRQTACWCLSRVSQFFVEIFLIRQSVDLISSLKIFINDIPSVSKFACSAIHYLTNYKEFSIKISKNDLETLFNRLFDICVYQTDQSFKVIAIYALASMIEKASSDFIPNVIKKIPFLIEILQKADSSNQSIICSLFCSIFSRADHDCISEQTADNFMITVIQIMNSRNNLIEEAVEAIGLLAENIDSKFEKYIPSVIPLLIWGIEDVFNSSICKVCAFCVGDLARALGLKFVPYINHFTPKFLNILSSETADLAVKIECIGSLGDICAIPGVYAKYMTNCLSFIHSAAETSLTHVLPDENPDLYDGLNSLRVVVLCFYIHLLNGVNEARMANILIGEIQRLIDFCLLVTQDYLKSSSSVHFNAIGLLGDIASIYQESIKYAIKVDPVLKYIEKYKQCTDPNLRDTAVYSYNHIDLL